MLWWKKRGRKQISSSTTMHMNSNESLQRVRSYQQDGSRSFMLCSQFFIMSLHLPSTQKSSKMQPSVQDDEDARIGKNIQQAGFPDGHPL
jgi:hypothetical protein